MALKTREKLIEVAKQLFIRNGVENTTIGDIANASDKGRRTIYTYFKNKKEIYSAVIEQESDNMVAELRSIAFSEVPSTEKLQCFFDKKLSQTKAANSMFSSLKALISLDGRRSELIRKKAYEKEEALLFYILDEGVDSGDFDAGKCALARGFIYRLVQGIDMLTIHDDNPITDTHHVKAMIEFFVEGVRKK